MKLVTFKVHTEERLGAYLGDRIVDLNSAYALYLKDIEGREYPQLRAASLVPSNMKRFLEGGEESKVAAGKALDYVKKKGDDVTGLEGESIFLGNQLARLCAPVPWPGKVYCMAVNYYDHVTERIKDPVQREAEIKRLK